MVSEVDGPEHVTASPARPRRQRTQLAHVFLARAQALTAGWSAHTQVLWPLGVAAADLYLLRAWYPVADKRLDWMMFFLMPSLFLLQVAAWDLWRRRQVLPRLYSAACSLAALLAGAMPIVMLDLATYAPGLCLLTLSALVCLHLAGLLPLAAMGAFFVLAAASACALRFIWWMPWPALLDRSHLPLALGWCALVAVAALGRRRWHLPTRLQHGLDAAGLLVLAFWSWRTQPLDTHHWAFIYGPARMLRAGGHLLWDVPAQYGFGSTLLVAGLPFGDPQLNLYMLAGALTFGISIIHAVILARALPGLWGRLVALGLSLSCVYFLPGWAGDLRGPQTYPSVAGLRFFIPFAILAIFMWTQERCDTRRSLTPCIVLGNVAWLLGFLWSAEVAVWSSVVYLPAALCVALLRAPAVPAWRTTLRFAATQLGYLLGTVAAAVLLYCLCTGHLPDLLCFIEYVFSYTYSEAYSATIGAGGTGWAWLLMFTPLAWAAMGAALRHKPLLICGLSLCWALMSYFVTRSHDNNLTNLAPVLSTGAGLLLYAARRNYFALPAQAAALAMVPLLCVLGLAGGLDTEKIAYSAVTMYDTQAQLWERGMQRDDPYLQDVIDRAGIHCHDPVAFSLRADPGMVPTVQCADTAGGRHQAWSFPIWLPVVPAAILNPLPLARRLTYLNRYLDHMGVRSGWFIQQQAPDPTLAWLHEPLGRRFEARHMVQNHKWRAIYLVARGPAAAPKAGP